MEKTMSEKKFPDFGYQPQKISEKGYQPQYVPTGDPEPQGGYQPTSTGENPANIPTPPADE
jgi:hypothetical protein